MKDHRKNVEEILHKVMWNTDAEIDWLGMDENDADIYRIAWHRWVMDIKFDDEMWNYAIEGYIEDRDLDKMTDIVNDMAEEFAW